MKTLHGNSRRFWHTIWPMIWPFAFLAGGLVSVFWGSHPHLDPFGLFGGNEPVMVNLHHWMWFPMALAHADALWRRRRDVGPQPVAPNEASRA